MDKLRVVSLGEGQPSSDDKNPDTISRTSQLRASHENYSTSTNEQFYIQMCK